MIQKDFLNNLWRWKCGLLEKEHSHKVVPVTLEELQKTEWSDEFERLMRNYLIMGGLRYGRLAHTEAAKKVKQKYDYMGEIIRRAKLYQETGNKELLVDIANSALIEFVQEQNHPNPSMKPEDDTIHFSKI